MTASRSRSATRPQPEELVRHLIGGKKMQHLGYVEATDEPAAIEAAVVLFGLDDERKKRLAVNPRR